MPLKFESFDEFWPFYLQQHRQKRTRQLHLIGTGIALVAAVLAMLFGKVIYLLAGIAVAYAFAWFGHFSVEGNAPATWQNPLWSLRADFKMFRLWVQGALEPELARCGIDAS